jgi:2-dehydropantoate 2-reductase
MGKRIAIVGAGAVGGYVGAHLTGAGHDVTLIDSWPAHVDAMRTHGLELYGMTPEERRTVNVNALHLTEVQSLAKQPPIDLAFISVKSYDTVWATLLIRPYLASDGCVISMQNCINEESVASVVGWGHTLGCIVTGGVGVDLYEPGRIRRGYAKRSHVTSFYVGEPHGRITTRAEEIADILCAADKAETTANLWGARWTKLCVNGMRNGVSAATGMGGNQRDAHDGVRRVCIALGGEAVRVGQKLGYKLDRIGVLDPETLASAHEHDAAALVVIERQLADSTSGEWRSPYQRPSMAQDIEKGRRTEIEAMNGFIAAKGAEAGAPAPTHARLTDVVKRVERGELTPRPENVLWN